jgi:hypothetical protein
MSSWATMLAATGFKPDAGNGALTIAPAVAGDFHAPWAISSGFGAIRRGGKELFLHCSYGKLELKRLNLSMAAGTVRLGTHPLAARVTRNDEGVVLEFARPRSTLFRILWIH